MHPLLAAAACRGNLEELMFLLNRGRPLPGQEFRDQLEVYDPGNSSSRSLAMRPTVDRIEEGTCTASSILEGVTVEGDTALHLLAANVHRDKFKECVDLIYHEDNAFLYKQNYNGDTPLHCAVRTRNSNMVSHLIGLARDENRVECLLRKENNSKETALHEAVRVGDNDIVKELLTEDPKLARFPEEGPSPLYLAIFLEEGSIAQTLYDKSEDHAPSYSGPDGQNALHVAVMRRTGTLVSIIIIYFEL
jgi:ankyrin repeat protein